MTSSRGGMAKMTEGGRGSENPEFLITSFVNAPLRLKTPNLFLSDPTRFRLWMSVWIVRDRLDRKFKNPKYGEFEFLSCYIQYLNGKWGLINFNLTIKEPLNRLERYFGGFAATLLII